MLSRATQFAPGNGAAVTHGLRATHLPPEFAYLQAEIEAFLDGALVDEGDAADVPTRRRALIEYRARLHRRIVQLDTAFELRGLIDKRGKLRTQWLTMLARLIDSAKSIDSVLGLERRAKPVPTLGEYLASRAAEQNDEPDDPADEAAAAEPDSAAEPKEID